MEAFPGWEVGETRGTVTTFSGQMEHPGTTLTGREVSLTESVMGLKTVLICGRERMVSGMMHPAALCTLLFARKVHHEILNTAHVPFFTTETMTSTSPPSPTTTTETSRSASTTTPSSTGCQAGWSSFNGSCYKHFSEEKTWYDAEDQCVNEEVRNYK